jgi:hypothetical protein
MSLSPKISALAWGRVSVEGVEGNFKDAKLYPGGAREWDWGETGTRHQPGIQPADVQELIENGAEAIVLSKGQLGRLRVMPETTATIEQAGIALYVEETSKAVAVYNRLADEGKRAGALIHSTC